LYQQFNTIVDIGRVYN